MKSLLSRGEYEAFVTDLVRSGKSCPLCEVGQQIVLGESRRWYWIASLSPYWRYHTLFIPKRHIEDISELSFFEFVDFQRFYAKVKRHVFGLQLFHVDKKPMDQFILMLRIREVGMPNGSTYGKPQHLHWHFAPDREGVSRFVLDPSAVEVPIETIALP